uniref:nicotinamidase n=1 Tax=Caligus clemensi TaxID=344056 RepID=C1C0A5_CALCM|nr:Pyrazinamidase/nicotinamidase [Caligus clemensi]
MEACFKAFDKDEDNNLNISEFSSLLKALFRNEKGKPYPVDEQMCNDIFNIFNRQGDGSMNKEEFAYCWNNWIKKIVRPKSALLIIDVQNDFISGSLSISECPAGENGEEVVAPINKLIDTVPFDMICYSLDWHPLDHISFVENVHTRKLAPESKIKDPNKASVREVVIFEGPPKTEQILWPAHCVQEPWGAELHKELKLAENSIIIHKGCNPDLDSYSAFFDNKKLGHTKLEEILRNANIQDLYVCGIATDVCVASTAKDSMELGFRTILMDNCSRGISSEDIQKTFDNIISNRGLVLNSSMVKPMVQGRDRRLELGFQLAIECRKKILYRPKNKNSKYNSVPVDDMGRPLKPLPTKETLGSNPIETTA